MPPDQWHVTLAFYGEVDEATVPELTDRLARAAARTPPLRLALHGAGTFPRRAAAARVLWCGLTGDLPVLTRLADRAGAAGRRSGLDVPARDFRPHLTLARCRSAPVDLRLHVAALADVDGPAWTATELRLVRSHLGARTRHERLAGWPLGGAE